MPDTGQREYVRVDREATPTYCSYLPAMRHHLRPHGVPWMVTEGGEGAAGRRQTCGTIPGRMGGQWVVSEEAAAQ